MELRIRYTGLEALPSSIHTKAQFLHIMNNVITLHPIVVQLIKGGMKIKEPIHFPRNNDSNTSVFIPDTDNSIIDCFSNNTSDSLNIPLLKS